MQNYLQIMFIVTARYKKAGARCPALTVWSRGLNHAVQTPIEGVNNLVAVETLGRKLAFSPFIPHGRDLSTKDLLW